MTPRGSLAAVLVVAAVALTGCSSANDASNASADPTPNAMPNGSSDFPGPGGGPGQFTKIRECLSAAGIELPTLPTGAPSFPQGQQPPAGGTPPPGFTPPAGGGADGPGGLGSVLSSPKAAAALKACGIQVPSAGTAPGA